MQNKFIIHTTHDVDIPTDTLTVWKPVLPEHMPFIQIDTEQASVFVSFDQAEALKIAQAVLNSAGLDIIIPA